MRTAVRITQVVVGLLFIVSGLVKANDPIGLSYKMEEFFELWNQSLKSGFLYNAIAFFHTASLPLSIAMITLEVAAGVALLLAWQKKAVLWLLLILIVFFTFLTGYAYLSGKFTNCGCFGDCLPISPLTSFSKDVALLVLILFLLAGQRYITAVAGRRIQGLFLLGSVALTLLFQWYVLDYLPVADCLPFKQGSNLVAARKPPPGSRPDSIAMRYIYEKNGKRYEWAPEALPADYTTYKFVDRIDKVVRLGDAKPAITGFSMMGVSGTDSIEAVLQQPDCVLAFVLTPEKGNWLPGLKTVAATAGRKGVPVYLCTSSSAAARAALATASIPNVQVFDTDFTVVRTAARTNATILILKAGTVHKKWGQKQLPEAAAYIAKTF